MAVFHPKMLYWQNVTGAVFQIKVSAEFVLKQFSEVSGLDGYSGKSIPGREAPLYSMALLQRLSSFNGGCYGVVLNVSR